MTTRRDSRVLRKIALLITIFLLGVSAQADTSRYILLSEQSTLIETGGIAGINRTYTITGAFQLTADFEAGTALFAQVHASADCSIPSRTGDTQHYNLDPNEVFNMTSLAGTIVDGGESIRFDGTADDGSSIQITLTFADGNVSMRGETVPPPSSADFFIYTLDALAEPKYEYSSGSGTVDDPYQIYTAADLIGLGKNPEDYDKHFILAADIDLDPNLPGQKVFDKAVIASDSPTNEYPCAEGTSFTGVFDGNGRTISHLTIAGGSYLGLFWRLGPGAIISNLYLEAVDVNGTDNYVGGLAGWNDGSIATSHSTGTVSGKGSVGGLVGLNTGGITTSYTSGTVIGTVSRAWMTGGLVGDNSGGITASYSTAKVTGDIVVGGLVGNNAGGGDLGTGIINTSYSTGLVTGTSEVGGLVGRFWGGMGGSVTLSFWDMEKSGQSSSAGGTGLTTAEMQDVNTYINAGWDFIGEVHNGTCDYWQMSPGDYPRFRYHIGDGPMMPEGLGTTQEPYLIRDARDLGTVWFKPSAHYRLESSLDLSQITWSMSVIPWFGGTFDGNGNVIRNLQIKGGGLLGLFGQLVSGAKISNLGLEASDINGSGSFVGGLVGESNFTSSITKSYSSGAINGDWYVGGLVGMNWRGDITSSYSTGTVRGNQCVGGLVGSNYGNIITSYSTVVTNGDQSIGGLVGMNWRGSITSCYSTGKVTGIRVVGGFTGGSSTDSSIIISFWDIETSGQLGSAGGIGKNTAEMQTAGTFLDAGWDFVDETDNGTEDIWWILEGQEYPRLWWEKTGN